MLTDQPDYGYVGFTAVDTPEGRLAGMLDSFDDNASVEVITAGSSACGD